MRETREPVFIEAFVTETTIERLDISILVWFARLDKKQPHATPMRPCQHRFTAKFLAIVWPDPFR
jgi:hypothetical protein